MESPKSPSGSVRRNARHTSHPLQRRSTKGPLDVVDDPLKERPASPQIASPTHSHGSDSTGLQNIDSPRRPGSGATSQTEESTFDFSFLQDRRAYHPIPNDDIAKAFLDSEQQPPLATPLPDLIQHGHFRRAAETALNELIKTSSRDAQGLLQLLYTRLACLVLIGRSELASDEAVPLTDFLARNAPGARNDLPTIPWDLRLFLVRLQSIAANDGGRRGIMALYALAGEARAYSKEAKAEHNASDISRWSERLHDLGLRVADALVEMGELDTANRHLDTLVGANQDEISSRKALLRVRVGDIPGAQKCLEKINDTHKRSIAQALISTANGEFEAATELWRSPSAAHDTDELASQNLAVCLLYTGRIADACPLMEDIVRTQSAASGILFNLSTIYELSTERAPIRKAEIAQYLASQTPGAVSGGWEKTNTEFKL